MLKSRSGAKAGASSQVAESIDDVRRRARHRLIGATILVLLGVVGFSLLFDSQPRPVAGLVPIEIPDRGDGAGSSVAPDVQADTLATGSDERADASRRREEPDVVDAGAGLDDGEEAVVDAPAPASAPVPATPVAQAAKPEPEPAKPAPSRPKVAAPSPPPTKPSVAEAPAAKPVNPSAERYVVQVGAFADASSVARVRQKLESAGMKTYTQAVDTAAGRRTRVRLGPFDSRASAEKAAARAKALGLPGRVLTL